MKIQDLENYDVTIYDVKDQLKRFLYNRSLEAFAAGDQARDAIIGREKLEARQAYIREAFIEAIGGIPESDTPLNSRVTGTVPCGGFKIENITFESRPSTFVTANLYIPNGITSPRGAVLFLCGHHENAKQNEEYQTVCQYLVGAGLVVLAMDPIGQGERLSYYENSIEESAVRWGTIEHDHAGSQCLPLGDSLARYFVHDAMRAIDYLITRQEVDPYKIGVTGNSGGGMQASLVMICDPRIAAAAPATFLMSRQTYLFAGGAQDSEQIWPGMSALGFDHEDILISMVPRPVLVMAVKYDFFPIEGTRRTVARARRFWEIYGNSDGFGMVEDASTHQYTETLARTAAQFFAKHLLNSSISLMQENTEPLSWNKLQCTRTGQVRGDFERARSVHDENLDRAAVLSDRREALSEDIRKDRALSWLREKVFASRKPCELNPRLNSLVGQYDELSVYNVLWWAQEGIFNHAFIFRHCSLTGQELPLTMGVWDGGTRRLQEHLQWIRETCEAGRTVMVLDVSGVGALTPHPMTGHDPLERFEAIHKLSDDLIWLNDSMAALRTYDVIRAVDMVGHLQGLKRDDIQVYTSGLHGIYGQLAAAIDLRISGVRIANGVGSVEDWVKARYYDGYDIRSTILPGMLQYFDLPDLKKWFANR